MGKHHDTDAEEIIVCGRLPKKEDGSVDLYKIDRFLKELADTRDRVAVLKRLLQANG